MCVSAVLLHAWILRGSDAARLHDFLLVGGKTQSKQKTAFKACQSFFLHSNARNISMASQARASIWQPWQRLETQRTLIFNDRANDRHTALRQPIRAEMPTGKKRGKRRRKAKCESDQRKTLPLLANAKTFEVLIKIYEEINI